MAPLQEAVSLPTRVLTFSSGAEQRFRLAPTLRRYQLQHASITAADVASLRTFFEGRKGGFDVFDFTINGTTRYNCYLDSDVFSAVESSPMRYDVTLSFHQDR